MLAARTTFFPRLTRERPIEFMATAEVSGFAQPACPVRCKLAAIGEIRPERVMSQADVFRQYAVRPRGHDSNKTAHRPRAPELRTVRQPPSRMRARQGLALRPAKRTVHELRGASYSNKLLRPGNDIPQYVLSN